MPKVPIPAQPPGSISPTLWNGENRDNILAFLGDLNAAYLFYGVMKSDPDPESSAIDEANAAKVDKITNLQKAQYLAQADSMFLSEKTQTPVTWPGGGQLHGTDRDVGPSMNTVL